ncbi:triacylglycerol lipase-like protein [Purpureocillium lavendulum]|uniref:Triacylglycerol lipase-like protein n=1 Tax=Purpureocillium lavendulum TaxID=1247861 RepID=A0AB34FVH1_9HYPO|nr:triacylglycerol lipase-like protein [Purpureocillium lavendulum]
MSDAEQAAAAAAAEAAFHKFAVESWTLYGIGLSSTILRTYARVRAVGFRNLRPDDYFIWVGMVFYTAQAALAYSVGTIAHGLANNGMTDAERAALSPDSDEFRFRVAGCKIQVSGWTLYSALIWSFKLSMLFFFIRLTEGLGRSYRLRIHIGFFLVIGTFLASIITIFGACRPFQKNWQINPDPGNSCQPAISRPVVWVSFASNISTDLYLIFIPLPMLWRSSLKLPKKIASTIVLGSGVFVLVCATLKSIFVLVDPINGAQLAGSWGTRESFVAVITTNLPMIFPLFKSWLTPLFGSALSSSQKTYQTPSGFQTIGGGGGNSRSRKGRGPPSANPITANMTFSESEERMVDGVKMQTLGYSTASSSGNHGPPGSIVVSKQVDVTTEDRSSHNGEQKPQQIGDAW